MVLALDGTCGPSATGADDRRTEVRGNGGTGHVGPMIRTVRENNAAFFSVIFKAFSTASAAGAEDARGLEATGVLAVKETPRTGARHFQPFDTMSIGTASAGFRLKTKLHGVSAAGEDLKLGEGLLDEGIGIRVIGVGGESYGGHQPKNLSVPEGHGVALRVAAIGDGL